MTHTILNLTNLTKTNIAEPKNNGYEHSQSRIKTMATGLEGYTELSKKEKLGDTSRSLTKRGESAASEAALVVLIGR